MKIYWVGEDFRAHKRPISIGKMQYIEMVNYDDIKDSLLEWHRLDEDPEDLPLTEPKEYVLIVGTTEPCGEDPEDVERWHKGIYESIISKWYNNEGQEIVKVIKWAYIPGEV